MLERKEHDMDDDNGWVYPDSTDADTAYRTLEEAGW